MSTHMPPQGQPQPQQPYQPQQGQQPYQDPPSEKPKKKGGCMKWGGIGLAIVIVLTIFTNMGDSDSSDEATPTSETSSAANFFDSQTEGDTTADAPAEDGAPEEPAASAGDDAADSDVPADFRNALRQADTYANNMHMSQAGLYDQLTSEYGGQFSPEAAQYAVDNVDADWKENALAKARSYQDTMAMSGDAVYDQLVSEYGEQFLPEEAQYAVDNL